MLISKVPKQIIGNIKELMKSLGAKKCIIRSEYGCTVIIAEFQYDVILVTIASGSFGAKYVSKIVPSSKLRSVSWTCDEVKYSPYGLYVIALNDDELLSKIKEKVEKVKALMMHMGG